MRALLVSRLLAAPELVALLVLALSLSQPLRVSRGLRASGITTDGGPGQQMLLLLLLCRSADVVSAYSRTYV
jgi:hypothetical protein